ncbi:MAG: histidine kinase dimerization/phosphoacceptor domain -containing protein [Balneolaceae bacterium]
MSDNNGKALSNNGWTPFTIDHLLTKHGLGEGKTLLLLTIWIGLIAASIISVLYMIPDSWVSGNLNRSAIYNYFMLYPPLIIGTLLLFWLGFEWGFIPVFLATFVIAFAAEMPFYWAILFGLAFVLGLGIYSLSYYCVPIDKSLRSLKSIAFFVAVSCVAAIASSLGSFIWSFANDMSVSQSMVLWRGWWTGVLLQSIFIIAPILFLITPIIEKGKKKWFHPPEHIKVTLEWIYGAILSVAVVLGLFIVGANYLGIQIVNDLVSALTRSSSVQILQATESFQIITWISIGLVLSLGLGGVYLVGSWNKSLLEEVKVKTTKLKKSEIKLKKSLEEKDILLDNIHSRMRSNLNIILALLEVQVKNGVNKDTDVLLRESHSRLESLALVHETMHQSKSTQSLNMKLYAVKLSNRLHRAHKYKKQEIDVSILADDVYIDLDRAMPFAMILNELIVNAYTHAFEEMMKGLIQVSISKEDDFYIIKVKDNGKGLPKNLEQYEKQHLGLRLIKVLINQMDGEFEVVDTVKSTFKFTIPIQKPSKGNTLEPEFD